MYSACNHFLRHLKVAKNASIHTIRNYAIDLSYLKQFVELHHLKIDPENLSAHFCYQTLREGPNTFALTIFDRKLMRSFLAHLTEKHKSKRSIVRKLSSCRSFFAYCQKNQLLKENPLELMEGPKLEKRIPVVLSYEQILRFFETCDLSCYLGLRDRAIMELFYSSALRVSELADLNRKDFDEKELLLRLTGKGNKQRIVPITRMAAEWIRRYLEDPKRKTDTERHLAESDPEAIFLNRNGTRITTRSIDRNFDKYLSKSGLVGKITPHTIRHTIATHWLENGMDLKTIQALLGHTCLATTTIYTQVDTTLKKRVYDASHPRA